MVRVVSPRVAAVRTSLVIVAVLTAVGGLRTSHELAQPHNTVISSGSLAQSATLLVVGAITLAAMGLWLANARLLVGSDQAGYRDIFRRTKLWTRGDVSRAVKMAVSYGSFSTPRPGVYLFDHQSRKVLVLSVLVWNGTDLADFVQALGVTVEVREKPVPIKAARREFPRAFGWGAQHLMLATILTMAIAVGLAIGLYAIFAR